MKPEYEIPCEGCNKMLPAEWWPGYGIFVSKICECGYDDFKEETNEAKPLFEPDVPIV
jgi:hypothetical protein